VLFLSDGVHLFVAASTPNVRARKKYETVPTGVQRKDTLKDIDTLVAKLVSK
jgi:hypothetical protein